MTDTPRPEVLVVGAGLAGLAAATHLQRAGVETLVVEAAEAPGGRVRTDEVDGLLLDRGFQLLNPAYPELPRLVDLDALDLRPFEAGVAVATADGTHVLGDPRRLPSSLPADLLSRVVPLRQKLALLAWAGPVGLGPVGRVRARADRSLAEELARRGLDGPLTERVLRPFLSGVLADDRLETSRRVGEMVLRSFVRGTPALPARGMQALPDQLAARLDAGSLRLGVRAGRVAADRAGVRVDLGTGTVTARAVVVATDPPGSADLLGRSRPGVRAPEPPTDRAILHVDGDRRGPLVNTAVVSNAAPGYVRAGGGALVAATVLGDAPDLASAARAHAGLLYAVDPSGWELVRTDPIATALPVHLPGTPLRKRVDLGEGVFLAGDHRDTPSIQGALVSGRRAAEAVLARLRTGRATAAGPGERPGVSGR